MSEGYWGLVWTFPGVLLWIVRMALELFWAFRAIWAVLFPLPFPSLSLPSSYGSLFSWGVGRGKFPIDDLPSSCQSRPVMSDPIKATSPPTQTTNALLEILYKRADRELRDKLDTSGASFDPIFRSFGMHPHHVKVGDVDAGKAIFRLKESLFSELQERNRQAYVEDWMNKNNQVLAMLREFDNQQG